MAIDTRDKRASTIGYKLPWRGPLPRPEGSLTAGDAWHLLGEYRGFEDDEAAVPNGRDWTLPGWHRSYELI